MNWTWRIDGTKEKSPDFSELFSGIDGGEDEDRTHDLRIANAALSQLSYPPTNRQNFTRAGVTRQFQISRAE